MSLIKAIAHGKEHRKTYRERGLSGEFDLSCRPHGGGRRAFPCAYCERSRTIGARRLAQQAQEQLRLANAPVQAD